MQQEPFGPLGGKYRDYVEDIHASGDILLQLVDRVLNLTWAEAHSREPDSEALADLSECLETCRRVVEPIARMRGLEMTVPPYPSMPKLRADRPLVKQILMNLLSNDPRHTPRGGPIAGRPAWPKERAHAITVQDARQG